MNKEVIISIILLLLIPIILILIFSPKKEAEPVSTETSVQDCTMQGRVIQHSGYNITVQGRLTCQSVK